MTTLILARGNNCETVSLCLKGNIMRRLVNMLAAMVLMAAISFTLAVPASAASSFADIAPASPYQECLEYLHARKIIIGTGGNQFSPDAPVTVRQWAMMLCRAYGLEDHGAEAGEIGLGCVEQCLKNGWLGMTAYEDPGTRLCWAALLESAFSVINLHVYNYELYPGGAELSSQENLLRIGRELELCGQDTTALQTVTRGEAARLLYQILTESFEIVPPPSPIAVQNPAGLSLNKYQLELNRVPQPILQAFQSLGWSYSVDFDYVAQYSREIGMSCVGLADYGKKRIIVSDSAATLHEMGHFLHCVLDFPKEVDRLYREESPEAAKLLRQYALTDSHEYFADCFAYWVSYWEDDSRMERFREILPETYQFFSALEANGWGCEPLLRRV